MSPRGAASLWAVLFLVALEGPASAWSHIAKGGETLDQLAVRYYGDKSRTILIRAANGFVHPDDGRLTEGERVEIPEVTYYRIGPDDTWSDLSNRFLASPKRAQFLAEINGSRLEKAPAAGTIVKLPYHLRHIFAPGETLRSVSRLYFDTEKKADYLRLYNNPSKKKYSRGEVIIVPLVDLAFTKEENQRIEASRKHQRFAQDASDQDAARTALLEMKNRYEEGKYVEIVSSASRLIGYGQLTVPQEIGAYNYLAYAYVALGERAMAVEAFKRALTLQPEMELSSITHSPKILAVFKQAKQALLKQKDDAGSGAKTPLQKK